MGKLKRYSYKSYLLKFDNINLNQLRLNTTPKTMIWLIIYNKK